MDRRVAVALVTKLDTGNRVASVGASRGARIDGGAAAEVNDVSKCARIHVVGVATERGEADWSGGAAA